MAIGRYKVVKVFEDEGVSYALGNQLALDDKEAKPLVDTGKVILVQMLDPDDAADAATIKRLRDNPATFKGPKAQTPVPAEATADADTDDESEDSEGTDSEAEDGDKPKKKGKK